MPTFRVAQRGNHIELHGAAVGSLDLSSAIERAFFISSCQAARANGTLAAIPGMEERFESLRNPLAARIKRLLRGR